MMTQKRVSEPAEEQSEPKAKKPRATKPKPEPSGLSWPHLFTVSYPDGVDVLLGNVLTAQATADQPRITLTPVGALDAADAFAGSESDANQIGARYTIVMVDPDAPSRSDPKYGPWRHWVVRLFLV